MLMPSRVYRSLEPILVAYSELAIVIILEVQRRVRCAAEADLGEFKVFNELKNCD